MGYETELDNICLSMTDETGINSLTDVIKVVLDDIYKFSNIISEFFVGKKDDIHRIYSAIRENKYPYNKIKVVDVCFASRSYIDYFTGLKDFVSKVLSLVDSDTVSKDAIKSTINSVAEKDKNFIDSIFGGNDNLPTEESIDSAMKNVEELIDIDNSFMTFYNNTELLMKNITETGEKYKDEKLTALKLYTISIRNYMYKCITTILDTFNSILQSMNDRIGVHGPKIVPDYQLF